MIVKKSVRWDSCGLSRDLTDTTMCLYSPGPENQKIRVRFSIVDPPRQARQAKNPLDIENSLSDRPRGAPYAAAEPV